MKLPRTMSSIGTKDSSGQHSCSALHSSGLQGMQQPRVLHSCPGTAAATGLAHSVTTSGSSMMQGMAAALPREGVAVSPVAASPAAEAAAPAAATAAVPAMGAAPRGPALGFLASLWEFALSCDWF
jgi:hypothetical protein